jgi:hypothetical protein
VRAPLPLLLLSLAAAGALLAWPSPSWPLPRPPGIVVVEDGRILLDFLGNRLPVRARPAILDQLSRLPGAVLRIRGPTGPRAVHVRAFEILDAGDGLTPYVGRVVVDQAGVQLLDEVTGTRLALRGEALQALRELHGARVWASGSIVGPRLVLVAAWGVLVPVPVPDEEDSSP